MYCNDKWSNFRSEQAIEQYAGSPGGQEALARARQAGTKWTMAGARLAKMAGELEENRVLLADLQERLDAAQTELLEGRYFTILADNRPLAQAWASPGCRKIEAIAEKDAWQAGFRQEERPCCGRAGQSRGGCRFQAQGKHRRAQLQSCSFLRQRLASIDNQTYKNYEVILFDDCSTDGSRRILEEYQQRASGEYPAGHK